MQELNKQVRGNFVTVVLLHYDSQVPVDDLSLCAQRRSGTASVSVCNSNHAPAVRHL
jgi:hypothetical protein